MICFGYSPEKNFKKLNSYLKNKFPEKFTCDINGDSLRESIKKIPKEAILKKEQQKIVLLFHKKWGSRVILKGVEEAFEDRFSYIEGVFEFIYPFIREQKYNTFKVKYDIFDSKRSNFKLRKKLTKGTYLHIFLKKNKVMSAKEYKNNELKMNIDIKYIKKNKYLLPAFMRIFFYEDGKLRSLNFKLMNFNFKPNITEEDFLG